MASAAPIAHAGRGPFAVLRRAKNVKNASETERDSLLEDAENLEKWSAWLVFGAILLEVATWASPLNPGLFRLGNLIADAAVALGIYGEMRFGHVVGDILKIRLAEASVSAATAQLEAERLRARFAGRRITEDEATSLREMLRGQEFEVKLLHSGADPEAATLASDLKVALESAGLKVDMTAYLSFDAGPPTYGVTLNGVYGSAHFNELVRAFGSVKGAGPKWTNVLKQPDPTFGEVWIAVGIKPPPF